MFERLKKLFRKKASEVELQAKPSVQEAVKITLPALQQAEPEPVPQLPRAKIYATNAERQAAYRERKAARIAAEQALKSAAAPVAKGEPSSLTLPEPAALTNPLESFWASLRLLVQPGPNAVPPAPVAVEPVPVIEPTPTPIVVPVDERPIDWDEERRTDLPMRTPGRIAFLLKRETKQQTEDRIANDSQRYVNRRGAAVPDVQSAISHSRPDGGPVVWERR